MAPIEALKLPKAACATPLLDVAHMAGKHSKGFFSQLDFFMRMQTEMMHLNRFRLAVEQCPKTFEMLIDYRRQIFETETPTTSPVESNKLPLDDLDRYLIEVPMISIQPSRKCMFWQRSASTKQCQQYQQCERFVITLWSLMANHCLYRSCFGSCFGKSATKEAPWVVATV